MFTKPKDRLRLTSHKLLMLTMRHVFFEAVKRAIRQQFGDEPPSPNDECQMNHIRTCVQAACRTMKLARDIRDMCQCPQPSLQMLHGIFDAAVILVLEPVIGTFPQDTSYLGGVVFAIAYLETERVDNRCQKDCARLLRDLQTLVDSLRNHKSNESSWDVSRTSSVPPTDTQSLHSTAYHVGFILNPCSAATNPMVATTSDALLSQLASWTAFDGPQSYMNSPLP
jgi:hypothetical protein